MKTKKLEVITLHKKDISDFAKERNLLLSKARSKWVFFVDTDEKISPALNKEVLEAIKDKNVQGYYVTRRDYMFGRELKHGEFSRRGWFGNARILRLGRKNAGKWVRPVHEFWDIKGSLGTLKNPLSHYPHKDLKTFIKNLNHFSTLHAKAIQKEGKKSSLLKIVVWPPGKFIYNFIFRLGLLDGMPGFMVALMMSFHSFLSWSKLWMIENQK